VLGEENGYPPLLVEAAQEPDQLVPCHRVQLRRGLIQEDEAGPGDEGGSEGNALELATRKGVDGAVEQVRNGEGEGDLLDRTGAGGRGVAAHLQRQLDLSRDGGRDDLGLGVLSDVADHSRELSRAGSYRVDAGHLDPPPELAAVEMRDEAAGGAEEGRLAGGGAAGEEGELARRQIE
jgi:hypothetical protein